MTATTDLPRLETAPNRPYILTGPEIETGDRDGWLTARRAGIGASDAAAILGLANDKYASPMTVFMEKTGMWVDDRSLEAADIGSEFEPHVAARYARLAGVTLLPKVGTLRHPDIPWLFASPDYLTADGNPDLVEVKTRSDRMAGVWGDIDGDDITIPDNVAVQVQVQMAVTGFTTGDVAVLFGGNRLRWAREYRDEAFINDLLDALERFWVHNVLAGVPPVMDGGEATTGMLSHLWWPGKDEETRVNLDPSLRADLELVAEAKRQTAQWDELQTAAENRIKASMGEGTHGYIGDQKVVEWKQFTRKQLRTKEMRLAHPGIVGEFTDEKPYRSFNPKYPKAPRGGDE